VTGSKQGARDAAEAVAEMNQEREKRKGGGAVEVRREEA
jgi:hypothetical protein